MFYIKLLSFTVVIFLLFSGCYLTEEHFYTPTMKTLLEKGEVMSVAELEALLKQKNQAGEKLIGYGKTVFEGTKIEKFEVEILDVMKNYWPKQDLIWIRCKHPKMDGQGVYAGMSGSPIYVNDK